MKPKATLLSPNQKKSSYLFITIPYSLLPVSDSRFPIPDSRFPIEHLFITAIPIKLVIKTEFS
ncbi:hypothetical protein [Moorena sp. SIO3B2]|uniref:hypothetical protein n=1 Tax=Moorena sp. SIO3B2 TaxID=2607827 RepID=UPI0013CB603B|nr:hypothetical protein [Moorena sp. SIO3B2]NEP33537.1 hypothetical protein [Moorena sp. SIO3B2]